MVVLLGIYIRINVDIFLVCSNWKHIAWRISWQCIFFPMHFRRNWIAVTDQAGKDENEPVRLPKSNDEIWEKKLICKFEWYPTVFGRSCEDPIV